MLSLFECKTIAQSYLNTLASKPRFFYDPVTSKRLELYGPKLEIADVRETPVCFLFSYQAEIDPETGEREEMGGNLPLAVDRATGLVDTAEMKVLAEFWPTTIDATAFEEALATGRVP